MVDEAGEQAEYDAFLEKLPQSEPRYAIYDFEFEKEGAGIRNKITFYSW